MTYCYYNLLSLLFSSSPYLLFIITIVIVQELLKNY